MATNTPTSFLKHKKHAEDVLKMNKCWIYAGYALVKHAKDVGNMLKMYRSFAGVVLELCGGCLQLSWIRAGVALELC